MNRRSEFLDIFLRGTGPSLELLSAFAVGLLVVSIVGNLVYDLLMAPEDSLAVAWRSLAASILLTGLAYLLYRQDRQRGRTVRVDVDESRLAPPYAGLVWLLGPGRFDHLLFALEHHREGGGGAHCWLVMQDAEEVRQAFSQLSQQLLEQGIPTRLHPVYLERLDVQAAYQATRTIFDREAREEGLKLSQVIADITGGIKPLTAGMVLAALTADSEMEYVESERDAHGAPIPGTLRVVLIDTDFYLAREE
jgi:hypothetical protein